MPQLTHSETTRFSPAQIYALVADVPSYPQFLPWCKGARILKQESDTVFLAELVIGFKGVTERYTSRVSLTPHSAIRAEMVEGPFHHLVNDWKFTPIRHCPTGSDNPSSGKMDYPHKAGNDEVTGTKIELELDFAFKSKPLETMIGGMFEKAAHKMTTAFRERARELYS